MADPIKVLIVDDSAIVRDVLSEAVGRQSDMVLCGTAPDPFIARDKIVRLDPDVVTLDIELPRLDGLTFLERLMAYVPVPVIIVSSISSGDPLAAIKALELGAFDVVNKPDGSVSISDVVDDVLAKIRAAHECRAAFLDKWRRRSSERRGAGQEAPSPTRRDHAQILGTVSSTDKLIAVGASTGGTLALEFLFRRLPDRLPPIAIVQHMPVAFTRQFAARLNEQSAIAVKEAEDGEPLLVGSAYIAPGGRHMEVRRKGASFFAKLRDGPKVNYQRPAVDVLFDSVAREAGKNALGLLLTGMGSDGAAGLSAMKGAGACTIAQDEQSSIIWGMPRAAVELGAADRIMSLDKMPEAVVDFCARKPESAHPS